MIKLLKKGKYSLVETRNDVKVLKLGKITFVWIYTKTIGEILVATHRNHKTDQKLAKGEYRIYNVKDEPKLVDQLHLELSIGEGDWQGYLLPTGFPKNKKTRSRIIPTNEIVTK
ncbi:hypothetical protein A2715_03630 [Candidatus Woesebacteria bacterium RIFCSPHIGHO2_01_FULL_39_32]|uniref:Uncharacterized protein n=1 Tax=Candidatus Woesebacteria bacterium RIFCSPLOWO2_01_FULL_39_25 TaxID=1802521 RepID=A0A1F8BKQ8_9BACT|nr:MAG: hypothetical protein A2124_04935 [Candidatus Woesebacteria bacterium GWB1_37_5]OGM24831.1 MAG: hypothetical protein A2715_03630 [Candidatus Woesebacteria bacterium RIFCSPHIGHO2_01_FULL_39_32]OGM37152.1 MAG: hypothetical protein A3F01_05570 [Candidatus Woesebacteria bacterium RIFCSPHIGHO2_12_FULL_38_11]OGM64657.1 MAG: hypothetical protein A2893_06545 [Candidatus Woesebacteria bacterium RIFCSPLOWO2_01_FULL_39_25]